MASAAPSYAAKATAAVVSSSLSKNLLRSSGGSGSANRRPAMPTLSKLLVAPSKVANALEWNTAPGSSSSRRGGWAAGSATGASILTVNLTRDSMELLVSSHPVLDEPVQTLPSIPLKTEIIQVPTKDQRNEHQDHHSHHHHHHLSSLRRLVPGVAMEFKQILQDWQVAGIVVHWPVQKEGWCGYACGKVLFVLDHLNSYNAFSHKRPMCLWDQVHHDLPYEDEWGRSECYSIVSNKSVHYASQEQYDMSAAAAAGTAGSVSGVWDDFCRTHWPECYSYAPSPPPPHGLRSGTTTNTNVACAGRSPSRPQPWLSTVPTLNKNLRDGG
jgi:hypothetical protein